MDKNARILFDSGAAEHFAWRPTNGGTLYDAQGHMIEAHGTRTGYVRPTPKGQSVGVELRVANVTSPILSLGKLLKKVASSTQDLLGCKTVRRDVVKNSLWVDVGG